MSAEGMSHSICSGAELLEARGRDTFLPILGEKFAEIINPFFIENQLQIRRSNTKDLISEPIVSRRDLLTKGEWIQASGLVWLKDGRGRIPHHMGVLSDMGPCLNPEEALFLMHCGELELIYEGMPLSLQAAYALLLQHSHWNYVLSYNYLASMGCRVHRHQAHLCTTKYEKKLNLNQDVIALDRKKKRVPLFPDENSTKPSSQGEHRNDSVVSSNSFVDIELQKFYASISKPQLKQNKPSKDPISIEDAPEKQSITSSKEYEDLMKRGLDRFISMDNRGPLTFEVEDHSLLPANSIPTKSSYTVSLSALNYFSKYDEGHSQDHWTFERKRKDFGCHKRDNFHPRKYGKNSWNRHGYHPDDRYNDVTQDNFYDRRQFCYNENGEPYLYGSDQNLRNNFVQENPPWKLNRFRKNHMKGNLRFPSCLVKSIVNSSSSWKEYKSTLKSTTETSLLRKEPCGILWKGKTVPLLKPSHATNLRSILSHCVVSKQTVLERPIECSLPPPHPYYDIYLPSVSYKPSEPPAPSARIFISKNESSFSQSDILPNISRYDDNVPCVFTNVVGGLPRMYSVTPLNALPDS